ncbi:MAG: nitrilase-related carbon-nitrogen hydrolase, partial [Pseudonocardiaceae bacterium]
MRITLAQIDSRPGELSANIERAERAIADAVNEGTDLVVFPELSLCGYSIGDIQEDISIPPDDERMAKLAKEAKGAGVLLGFAEAQAHGLHTYNSAAYWENGLLVHVHRKLYLPNYATFEERKHFL